MGMDGSIAKCGCDCTRCPSYRNNLGSAEDRIACSSGWHKCFDIRLSPDKLRECYGCSIPDGERKQYYLNCRVRKCCQINEMENCAYCSIYPCLDLLHIHSVQEVHSKQGFEEKTGKQITDAEYTRFVEPYCGIAHLDQIRRTLPKEEISPFREHSLNIKFARLENADSQPPGIRILYHWLTNICVEERVSFARLQTLRKIRMQLLRIIWTVGLYGSNVGSRSLEVESNTFLSQKIIGNYQVLAGYLNGLKAYEIHCDFVPLSNKEWLTPGGGIRKEGWKFRMRLEDRTHGPDTIRALQGTCCALFENYGERAFHKFSRADLGSTR
jgi:hypothetical protein